MGLSLFFFPTPANPRGWPEEDRESLVHFPLLVLFLFECS